MAIGQFEVVPKAKRTPGQTVGQVSFFDEKGAPIDIGGGAAGPVAFDDLTGVPAALTAPQPANVPSVRAMGTTATTAAAGDHKHAASAVTVAAGAGIVGGNVQLVLADLAARVVALEAKAT